MATPALKSWLPDWNYCIRRGWVRPCLNPPMSETEVSKFRVREWKKASKTNRRKRRHL